MGGIVGTGGAVAAVQYYASPDEASTTYKCMNGSTETSSRRLRAGLTRVGGSQVKSGVESTILAGIAVELIKYKGSHV